MILDLDGFSRVDELLKPDLVFIGEVARLTLLEQRSISASIASSCSSPSAAAPKHR
jgi:hypothetical protein